MSTGFFFENNRVNMSQECYILLLFEPSESEK